jgi:hypothetical protein
MRWDASGKKVFPAECRNPAKFVLIDIQSASLLETLNIISQKAVLQCEIGAGKILPGLSSMFIISPDNLRMRLSNQQEEIHQM